MAIVKPLQRKSVDAFISGAPDAASAVERKGVVKGRKQQISLTIKPELLDRVDAVAGRMGQSRAAIINLALFQSLERGLES